MKKLIILLLIVGCAHKPPQTTFYIGMTKEEFRKNNLNIVHAPFSIDNTTISIENEGSLNEYIFAFDNDSLFAVYHNFWNMSIKKEIDYDKYATPPE